jgi:hypothetical protein
MDWPDLKGVRDLWHFLIEFWLLVNQLFLQKPSNLTKMNGYDLIVKADLGFIDIRPQ